MYKTKKSGEQFERAKEKFPGGVNSPVRAFGSVGGHPIFFDRAKGAHLWDIDSNRYIDYVGSWGPAILGHNNEAVEEKVIQVLKKGFSFGAPTIHETLLAEKITELMPLMERMRFVSSGTEACMSVVRLARGHTGRNKILKFSGCYHGHADMFLVKAGSGVATLGIPGSPGVPDAVVADTLTCEYNDVTALDEIFNTCGKEIAAVILEPFIGNAGFIRARNDFLLSLRKHCDASGSLLIFDEVMTGFRVHKGGAQSILPVAPDLVTLGKIVGGGLPVGVYGGRRDIMATIAPEGPVYQAGTLSGHPAAMASGLQTLEELSQPGKFEKLTETTQLLVQQLNEIARENEIPFIADSEGGMFGFFFRDELPANYREAQDVDVERFRKFFHGCLERGVYFAPSAFEAGFVSMSHSLDDIEATVNVCREVFSGLRSK